MARTDVVIVGGGVIGAAIAYYLSEAGTRVTLLERGRAGGHASLASAGLLHPMYRTSVPVPLRALTRASFALYPDLVARLFELTGIDAQYRQTGWLTAALDADETAALRDEERDDGYDIRLVSGDEARDLEPGLSPDVACAVYAPHGAHIYVPALLQALTHAAARLGATIRRGVEVAELRRDGSRVTGVRTLDGEKIAAGQTVVAGGAWSPRLLAPLGVALPVRPLRGQILSLYAIPLPLRHVVFGNGVYVAPKVDGSAVVGATYEDVGFDDRLTATGVGWLLTAAPGLVPALADATYRQAWVGLRPASPSGAPFLGDVPGWDGITVAAGHTAEGVLLTPITGKVIAQRVRGLPTDLSLEPFSLARA